jgi:hypothetical protein
MLFKETAAVYYWEREGGGNGVVVVRDTILVGGMKILFPFEGSQATAASPSDKGEV